MTNRTRTAILAVMATLLTAAGCGSDSTTGGTDASTTWDSGPQPDGQMLQDGHTHRDGQMQQDRHMQPDGAIIGDGGTGDLVISFGTITHWADCMPAVPPDPWHISFDLVYDNGAGSSPVSITIVSVKMVFNTTAPSVLDINVTPTNVGPVAAGATTTETHSKTSSNNDLPNDCGLCGETAQIEITVDVGGVQSALTSNTFNVSCVY